jgi:hypothetical protein
VRIYRHNNYRRYVRLQRALTEKKTDAGQNWFSWATEDMMIKVNNTIHSFKNIIGSILCHGCRSGIEVNMLKNLNPDAEVFGTDLYGPAYKFDRTYFREMDFDTVPKEWVGYFDVVYSNSLDHSRNPINTLLAWKSELKNDGILFATFTIGRGLTREDCFHLDELNRDDDIKEISEKINMKVLYTSDLTRFGVRMYSEDIIFGR